MQTNLSQATPTIPIGIPTESTQSLSPGTAYPCTQEPESQVFKVQQHQASKLSTRLEMNDPF